MKEGILIYALNNNSINYLELAIFAAKRVKQYLNKPVAIATDSPDYLIKICPEYKDIFDYLIKIVVINKYNNNNKKPIKNSNDNYETNIAIPKETTENVDKAQITQVTKNETTLRNILEIDYFLEIEFEDLLGQNRIYFDGSVANKILPFKNSIRIKSYEITPFDKTLIIDADYIISNDKLNHVWSQEKDILLYKKSVDMSGHRYDPRSYTISDKSIDFYWATVCYFEKTDFTKIFFDLLEHIYENWGYYVLFYQLESKMYRNDFAFSIAIHILNGYEKNQLIGEFSDSLCYTLDKDILIEINDSKLKFLIEKQDYYGEYTLLKTEDLNIHIMNKFSIERFIKGIA